jgi:hypothetical protein
MDINTPEIQCNEHGDCTNVNDIIQAIKEQIPRISDETICDGAGIERSTLNTWRKKRKANVKKIRSLIDYIKNDISNNADMELEGGECGGSSLYW